MAQDRALIVGSERTAPSGKSLRGVDPEEHAELSVYLKRPASAAPLQSREAMLTGRTAALRPAFARLEAFAKEHGLSVVDRDPARRRMTLGGALRDLEAAFGTQLQIYDHPQGAFRGRAGPLTAPSDVVDIVEAVLGLDQRPVATPKSIRLASPTVNAGFLPNEVTARYGFPTTAGLGRGVTVAIIELGGGVSAKDTAAAFKAMNLAPPKVLAISVDKARHQANKDANADGEVALDVQVAGAGAPGATLAVYFAPNTDQGFVDAITQAANDAKLKPAVMSISWGSAESTWTQQAVTAMNSAFQDAAELGVSTFAASGDGLATDGQSDGRAHVDFPSSSPWVVACGGTRLASGTQPEAVWKSNGGGTGGGISDLFDVPAYQQAVHLPPSANSGRKGRGVPDVAGDADPNTGYRVVVDGKVEVIGGTSGVAPLWAGLFALVVEAAGKPVGQPHQVLYANPAAFNDVTEGNNKVGSVGYAASPGWDACTGLGTPKAQLIAGLF